MAAACIFPVSSALAQEYRTREVAGWTVSVSDGRDACFIAMDFEGEGETSIILSLGTNDENRLIVSNYNWSIKDKEELSLNFHLSSGGYSDHFAVGFESGGKRGFVTNFEAKFPTYFAGSKYLHVYRGEVPVDQLSLDGSGAAVAELRRCVGLLKARAAAEAREKARFAHIPKDPFATDGAADQKKDK